MQKIGTISVAMCTYNGAKYIEEQLKSILNQSRRVHEIVICDDGSIDETLALIDEIKQNTTIVIRIVQNKTNLGYYKNFLQALSLCTGDIIFLSDQDDVWREDKVEKMVTYFEQHNDVDVLFTNAKLIDDKSKEFTSETLWDRVGFTPKMQRYFKKGYGLEIWTINNRATGAAMAVRKAFIDRYEWEKFNLPVHDYIISLMAVIEGRCHFFPETLTSYRIHSGQTIGALHYEPCFYSPLMAYSIELKDVRNIPDEAYARLDFMRRRERLYGKKLGEFKVISGIINYIKIYKGWWFRFLAYDFIQCVNNDLGRVKKKLR